LSVLRSCVAPVPEGIGYARLRQLAGIKQGGLAMDVVLEEEHGKDGHPYFPYVHHHPTSGRGGRCRWRRT
jgi:hypothetical protein